MVQRLHHGLCTFNYVAQPTDYVKLTPPRLGVYDYHAIGGLTNFPPGSKGFEDDAKQLRLLADKHGATLSIVMVYSKRGRSMTLLL